MISSELPRVDISEDNCIVDGKDFNLSNLLILFFASNSVLHRIWTPAFSLLIKVAMACPQVVFPIIVILDILEFSFIIVYQSFNIFFMSYYYYCQSP